MRFSGRNAIVTGGGQGIGRAIARALADAGATVCVCDLDAGRAHAVAQEIGGTGFAGDMTRPADVEAMVATATEALGQIDLLVSNAGFAEGAFEGPDTAPDAQWQRSWDLHVMAHLRAARLLLPGMLERGEGWLVSVASAAGLLSQIGDAPYSASKHAAVSLAQSLAIEYGHRGIRSSVVCPLYVATPMLGYDDGSANLPEGVLTSERVAEALLAGLRQERVLILPHPDAAEHMRRRAEDPERWIAGMRRLRAKLFADGAPEALSALHRRY